MYATQSSRLGVPRHATVTPLRRRRRRPSTFASGFLLPSIVVCPLQERPVDATAVQRSNKREPSRANLTSGVFSVSRSRFSAKSASERRRREGDPRGIPRFFGERSRWTNGPSYFGDAFGSPRQTVRFRRMWTPVDKWKIGRAHV